MMKYRTVIRNGGTASILAGAFHVSAALALPASIFFPVLPGLVLSVFVLFSNILVVFALISIYALLFEEKNRLVNYGFALAIAGHVIKLTDFFSPAGSILFFAGLFILAVCNHRQQTLSKTWPWVWIAGSAITIVSVILGMLLVAAFGMLLVGISQIALGLDVRTKALSDR